MRDSDDAPVIVDDGGSTRIRQVNADNDDMDGLQAVGHQAKPRSTFKKYKLVVLDADGEGPSNPARPLQDGDRLVIDSAGSQTTTIVFARGAQGTLEATITLTGSVEPQVDRKTDVDGAARKRYIVTNAGRILTITLFRNGRATTIYDAYGYDDIVYVTLYFLFKP